MWKKSVTFTESSHKRTEIKFLLILGFIGLIISICWIIGKGFGITPVIIGIISLITIITNLQIKTSFTGTKKKTEHYIKSN